MNKERFNLINRIAGAVILVISAIVYLATIEPTVSFWDCGEFIASSYKLEVGHPPGNPVFQLFGRFFTLFADKMHAAAAVNAMSALCSAFTIFFLYLTIVHFGRRILEIQGKELKISNVIALIGSGAVGALAYCFSDTFWFSAVEGEVYAMSSLFTAVVFWAILMWEEEADQKYANRWIVLISFLMGLSIGVHLLNLLTIPAIVFIYYYKKSKKVTWKGIIGVFALSVIILAVLLFGIIPYLPKVAALVDRIFVNGFGTGYNVGASVFMVLLLAGCFYLLKVFRKKNNALWHTITLCFTTIIIGYSVFAIVIIRSCANTPTNEYQPDNPYTLIRYLGREQYGTTPLLYGQSFNSPYEAIDKPYYTPLDGKYYKASNLMPKYPSDAKMFFPRMHDGNSANAKHFYESYVTKYNKKKVKIYNDSKIIEMPSFKDNINFFFNYQINYMYVRYFLWNFVGRQNDFHGQTPYDLIHGNWESGIKAIDNARLGDQSIGPDILVNNAGKNHYYFLPLILGLIGLFFQVQKDPRNSWVTGLLFLLTGLAIVVYLNQNPYQVRERDYAYAGSFYVFTIWIGLAVLAIKNWIDNIQHKDDSVISAAAVVAIALCVPILMGCENWDDHDRSGRYTVRDLAYDYLNTTGPNAIIVTHGDNDTFPLWYAQEVEGIRTDVRIMNTSLLGIDWYIDQMKNKQYESDPLPITIDRIQYLYGTNDFPYVVEVVDYPILASQAIDFFRNPKYKLSDGETDYLPAKQLIIPVNKENVIKYGLVPEKDYDKIVDNVTLTITKDNIGKTDLIILDMLAHYNWDRPIYFVSLDGDVDLNLRPWLRYNGFTYQFVPIQNENTTRTNLYTDADIMYDNLMNKCHFESLKDTNIHFDYQNLLTFCGNSPIRDMFVATANALIDQGDYQKALEVLDRAMEVTPIENIPYCVPIDGTQNDVSIIEIIENYLALKQNDKAERIARLFSEQLIETAQFYANLGPDGEYLDKDNLDQNISIFYYLISVLKAYGATDLASELTADLDNTFGIEE